MKAPLIFLILFVFISINLTAQTADDCLACHDDNKLTTNRGAKEISLFVDPLKYNSSIHSELDCIDCHSEFDPEEIPHKTGSNISRVDCSQCHDTEEFENSIHGEKKVKCYQCHTKHSIQDAASISENEIKLCLSCHKTSKVKDYTKSIHYKKFIKGENSPQCIDCHDQSPHGIKEVSFTDYKLNYLCGNCHLSQVNDYEKSLHGKALKKGMPLAPNCLTCHNSHKIQSPENPESKTYVTNIPFLCGDCHKDGTKISELKIIGERHILENYKESIHGDGLLKKGLKVTAVCTSCHSQHNILPHTDPESSINEKNIAATCMQCHAQIEKVHTKVIRGELWEKEPNKIPACIECHPPHSVRQVFYEQNFADKMCMECHSNKKLTKTVSGKKVSLYVDSKRIKNSVHKDNTCIKCHTNVRQSNNPVCLNSGKVDCSACHAEIVEDYQTSRHGILHSQNDLNAPYCTDCHEQHSMTSKKDINSPTFRRNIPQLCSKCHREGESAAKRYKGIEHNIIKNYRMSIHGKGLEESGLMVSATCIDCHTAHHELPASDPMSTVNENNIPQTCSNCHLGIFEKYKKSVHSAEVTKTDKPLPSCYDCHRSHTIERVDQGDFRKGIIEQCGHCHMEVTKTYFDTFHGKFTKLGSIRAAKCYDCHGSHNILPPSNPESTLSLGNVVQTCKACHPNSNRKFVGYLTHATHHDKEKYPILYYTFWTMTILLVSTFIFFGLHTLLWLPRALAEKKKQKRIKVQNK